MSQERRKRSRSSSRGRRPTRRSIVSRRKASAGKSRRRGPQRKASIRKSRSRVSQRKTSKRKSRSRSSQRKTTVRKGARVHRATHRCRNVAVDARPRRRDVALVACGPSLRHYGRSGAQRRPNDTRGGAKRAGTIGCPATPTIQRPSFSTEARQGAPPDIIAPSPAQNTTAFLKRGTPAGHPPWICSRRR